ncbi:MAG: glycosyltransferase family 39 protein [Actinobacteria bacterium]|nr:glycosyltransferase family 39 protein [Actinomycetota bacterium]
MTAEEDVPSTPDMAGLRESMPRARRRGTFLFLVVLTAAALRIAWIIATPNILATDFYGYHQLGKGLAARTIPWTLPGIFHWTPGYPYFLALIYKSFGSSTHVARLANAVLGTLSVVLVYFVAREVFSRRVASLSAAIYALLPTPIFFTALVGTETLFVSLTLAAVYTWFLTRRLLGDWAPALLSGALFGLAGLVRASGLLLPAALLPLTLKRRDVFLRSLAVVTIAFIIVLPWLMRTQILYGTFNMQVNGGVFLWQGNHENSTVAWGDFPWVASGIPYQTVSAETYYKHPKEASTWGYRRTFEFLKNKPLSAARGVLLKGAHLIFGEPDGVYWNQTDDISKPGKVLLRPVMISGKDFSNLFYQVERWGYWLLLIPAIGGITLVLHMGKGRALLIPPAVWILLHTLTVAMVRYRFPIYPFLAIYGALALCIMVDALRTLYRQTLSREPNAGS